MDEHAIANVTYIWAYVTYIWASYLEYVPKEYTLTNKIVRLNIAS